MSLWKSAAAGWAGAVTLNVVHESARQFVPSAPRVDIIGKRATQRYLPKVGVEPPGSDRNLYATALAGDVISNSAYYAMVGVGDPKGAVRRGTLIGLVGGIGSLLLPPLFGFDEDAASRRWPTSVMTVAWYTVGGFAAGLVRRALG